MASAPLGLYLGGGTRLLARGVGGSAGGLAFDVAHFVMERAMLLGIRNRVMAELAADR